MQRQFQQIQVITIQETQFKLQFLIVQQEVQLHLMFKASGQIKAYQIQATNILQHTQYLQVLCPEHTTLMRIVQAIQ